MTGEFWYGMAAIAVGCIVTMMIRSLPFVLFKEGKLPPAVEYLGRKMPEAVMVVLIIFCLRGTDVTSWPHGIPEVLCAVLCAVMQLKIKNSIPSIAVSTILYILLTRYIF